MQIKWNWGTKIFLAYSIFVLGMLFLVYMCTQQHFDLVRSDYYEAEIAFQQQLNSNNNSLALEQQPKIADNGDLISIVLPSSQIFTKGEAYFYKPDNAAGDKRFPLTTATTTINKADLQKGLYAVKLSWQADGKDYYFEEKHFIEP